MFNSIIKRLKSMNGNSLAEFAVTTAMMATLAATAAPQFGSVGEGAKEKKTMNNIDKIVQLLTTITIKVRRRRSWKISRSIQV